MYLDNSLDRNCTSADIKELSSNIPASPKYMNRSKFIANMDDRESLFPTLLQFISGRQNSVSSDKAVILGINKFFEFIEINYADDSYSDIAGATFRNPINISFDSPRDVGRRSQKTTKKIIPQKTGSAIKNWLYCAEALVTFMDEKRLYRKFMGLKGKVNKIINSEEFGFVPFYYDGKKCIAVKSFPFDILTPLHKENRISASILRMIILSFETGLRLQSSQWLCRRNFSRYFVSNSVLIFPLYVNTDKVNDGFVVPIIHRVADMLKRESEFQASLGIDDVDVTYEGRAFTRFEHLLPLFRNPETRLPFNDSSYALKWIGLCAHMERFHPVIGGDVELTTSSAVNSPGKLRAIHTPHALRGSFVSNMSKVLDIADIAKLVGHESVASTWYYNKPDTNDLDDKLLYANKAVETGHLEEPSDFGMMAA